MGIHAVSYYEEPEGMELVDVAYQCSFACMLEQLRWDGITTSQSEMAGQANTDDGALFSWGAWPCGSETDYDVYCSACGNLLHSELSV